MKHKYEIVKEKIINWAINGKYKPHEKIPTESEMMDLFQVSRHTIRRALSDLSSENYLYRIQGSGIYMSDFKQNESYLKKYKNVGVLTTYISNYIFPDIIGGIEDTLYDNSYSLLLSSTRNNMMFENRNLNNLLAHKVDGIIIEPTKSAYQNPNMGYLNNLIEQNVPFITINSAYPQIEVPSLCVNDFKGGQIAAECFFNLGHKNIMGIFKVDDLQGVYRMNGFISECQKNDVLLDQDQIITYLSEETDSVLPGKIKRVINKNEHPTGVFCYNDEIAFMVVNIAHSLDLKVPEDISVIGFDDSQISKIMNPRLTTITHPKQRMGIDAAKLIIKLVNNNNKFSKSDSILYEPELIVRDSTAPID
ncbi:GntR family transcriptional regulator [Clostridium luticellarii]|jgi:GntR family transcriptional regulator of arabinose operon|uniref:Arabinose metabolism transcriptional repressor n=1 Tax=Clostridium luticellarii TaxID=1691940 RepID=A0A2T0BLY0_9CLOT|nr:GntR family transcriptional regulator [Clostridium luticellarii]MCI1945900.1 GntR family transcriptional regulator [Clostridium luticellarii]MCI1969262.1 GntR family transcriptional regulator [Clostridium luticellarii]MCI1996186.1 GntR family transcriptional regulator [Clostridium luticellarii]MCI2040565.1 GntR family transcriptional regulator [Clostridium luticellarii]PRR84896.1 Arabinose metabolism transcriptional repressor [Clostridium luticellarii]